MKTIFITGTSSGLGEAAVKLFQSEGWKVIATMRDIKKGHELAALENVTVLPLDVTYPDQIKSTVAHALSMGEIDVVVNNAAVGSIGPLEGFTEDQMLGQINTNLLGAINVTRAFLPAFRAKKGGLFINITSIAGLVTFPFASLYNAVKFGLQGLSESMYFELKPFGIGIKTVAPGGIRSAFAANIEMARHPAYEEMMNPFLSIVGNPDVISTYTLPEDIAKVVYEAVVDGKDQIHYIAGDDARHMSESRLQNGAEASVKEIERLFLG